MRYTFFALFVLFSLLSNAQTYTGRQAAELVNGSILVRITDGNEIPDYVQFSAGNEIPMDQFFAWLRKKYYLDSRLSLIEKSSESDLQGITHTRYDIYLGATLIHHAKIILHHAGGKVNAWQGDIPADLQVSNSKILNASQALEYALEAFPSQQYKWQNEQEEQYLKAEQQNPSASFFPTASLVLFPTSYPKSGNTYLHCYAFDIYSENPLFKKKVLVNAESGAIVFAFDMLHQADAPGTANTKYSGIQEITTDSYNGTFRLREAGRGQGIRTLNMQNGTSYGGSLDFVDTDNYWSNFNAQQDEAATDAHWAMEMTYDYYYNNHNRNSIDNAGFMLLGYVHYDNAYANAFWDGQRMTFGDGDGSSFTALTAIDVVGHEITHGLTSYTGNMDYAYEPGALNEAFSDIFGTAIEYYGKSGQANWTIGEDMGSIIRSMSNPNQYGNPDTYQGNYWVFGSEDNGGVHTNSGPMCYWYYLLCMGGSGTNDIGNAYQVNSITREKADKIAFRTLVYYLTNTSDYADARFYSIMAAIDLYGACSDEVEQVTKAWYAVGVGVNYVDDTVADFETGFTEFCSAPVSITFDNLSVNGTSFSWNFGDGSTSSDISPSHTYTAIGDYTVTLITDGGTCGMDTLIMQNYISVDPLNPCIEFMGLNSSETNANCTGILFDNGGAGNYSDETSSSFTIAPSGALAIILNFSSFSFEDGYDYLRIYDGPSASSTLIGEYTGGLLPNGGTITSSAGSITLVQSTDVYLTASGFELTWSCVAPNVPPDALFSSNTLITCDGQVAFDDNSTNIPNAWSWDFGDGNTSTQQNPVHQYQTSGSYTVSLHVYNSYGEDSLIVSNMILVDMEFTPNVPPADGCQGDTISLEDSYGNLLFWYLNETDELPVSIGNSFEIQGINSDTTFWVEGMGLNELRHTGKPDNSGGGSYFTSGFVHYQVFDVYKPVRLVSVLLYSGNSGTKTIRILDEHETELAVFTPFVETGENRVLLNLDLPVGQNYRIASDASPNLYRNNAGVSYPYKIDNLISINYSSAGNGPTDPTSLSYYYFFYDWEVIETSCVTEKLPVTASVSLQVASSFSFQQDEGLVNFTSTSTNANYFEWDFGDGNHSTDMSPEHTYTNSGNYLVSLTSSNGCFTDVTSQEIHITIGIDEITDNELHIYPNPTKDQIYIQSDKSLNTPVNLRLFSMDGRVVYQKEVLIKAGLGITVFPGTIADGIYQLELSNEVIHLIKSLIVQQ